MRRRRRDAGAHAPALAAKGKLAREQRASPTPGEARLWCELRRRALTGWRFRRQHVIGGFIVDFYCPRLQLAVEVDGDVHRNRATYDESRDRILADMGVATVRVRNRDVLDDCRAVLERLQHVCAARAMTRFGRMA